MNGDNENEHLLYVNKEIIKLIDGLLSDETWHKSTMFRASAKKLERIKGRAQDVVDRIEQAQKQKERSEQVEIPEDHTYIYIFLFQANGDDVNKWQQLIRSLPQYNINRPTYADEDNVRKRIRYRGDRKQEGYVKVLVKQDEIITSYAGRAEKDYLGSELVTVREEAIKLDNITEFVHANNQRYKVDNGKLMTNEDKSSTS